MLPAAPRPNRQLHGRVLDRPAWANNPGRGAQPCTHRVSTTRLFWDGTSGDWFQPCVGSPQSAWMQLKLAGRIGLDADRCREASPTAPTPGLPLQQCPKLQCFEPPKGTCTKCNSLSQLASNSQAAQLSGATVQARPEAAQIPLLDNSPGAGLEAAEGAAGRSTPQPAAPRTRLGQACMGKQPRAWCTAMHSQGQHNEAVLGWDQWRLVPTMCWLTPKCLDAAQTCRAHRP